MRILITDFFGILAGSSYSALYLAEGLAKNGHDVWFAYKKGSFLGDLVKSSQIKGVPFSSTGKFNLSAASRISRIVKDKKIDVVNAQASPDRYITIFARWLFGMPGILIHTRRQKPDTTGGCFKAWFYAQGTDKIIAVSPAIKKFLIRSGIPAGQIEVILNGIPESKGLSIDQKRVEELRKRYRIKDKDLVIGCVSRIKQQDQILKAVSMIKRPVKVLFVGIEDSYPHLKQLIGNLPPTHEVFFTGEVSNSEALNHYPLFTIKILLSDMEGFSQSLLEAMVLEVPVIATNASGNPDLIEDGVNGFLVENNAVNQLYELIEKLAIDSELKISIVKIARERVQNRYLMSKAILEHNKFLEALLVAR